MWTDVFAARRRPRVVALGNFDGVHVGHLEVLAGAVAAARERGAAPAVLVLHPHPRRVLRPETFAGLLTPLPERRRWLARAGVEEGFLLRFDRATAAESPEWFAAEVLAGALAAQAVVVGANYRFGRGQEGDVARLEALGRRHGFAVGVVAPRRVGEEVASASLVREALSSGDLARARRMLGRPYAVEGLVVAGEGRGRRLGFPTANLAVAPDWFLPRRGVYQVVVPGYGVGVANLGRRPTFGGQRLTLEVHLLDGEGDLYGRALRVVFARYLREEAAFPDVAALTRAIAEDVARARALAVVDAPEDLW
jgi:riboflavin kinase/FMN adenylyltransferase